MTQVLRPGIRTYKPRRSRITSREQAALATSRWLVRDHQPGDSLLALFGPDTPVVLEIGFGTGSTTTAMAASRPDVGVLAVDVHTPGVGDLLDHVERAGLTNVRVLEGDALGVLASSIPAGSLAGIRSYFPDPWPKARHHKRRLVQPAVVDLARTRLTADGFWHLATDWADYAESMQEVFADRPGWTGGVIPRPEWRPVTHYERRALREGRDIVDLMYRAT